jgi:hypothetical protein
LKGNTPVSFFRRHSLGSEGEGAGEEERLSVEDNNDGVDGTD